VDTAIVGDGFTRDRVSDRKDIGKTPV